MSDIYIVGEINDESYLKFTEELKVLEDAHVSDNYPVQVCLMSDGGSAYAAMAFYDRIKYSHLHLTITGIGFIASAATLVLAAGDSRVMTKNAWVMVHEDIASELKRKEVHQAERELAHMRRLENQWNDLLAKVTKTSSKRWEALNKATTYLSPQDCLELGLIEEII